MRTTHNYLFIAQFLGFRYSGWQRQPGQKTVEDMLLKTLNFILPKRKFKVLGAGRTDAKVSALEAAFELYLDGDPIQNIQFFIELFNRNLPPDIKILKCIKVNEKFNIINDVIEKEYAYFFSYGNKSHPFAAPFMTSIQDQLNIELMKEGAALFAGNHNFKAYTTRDKGQGQFERSIRSCKIVKNDILKANFFPDESYMLIVRGKGFLRYQVRMIMAMLFMLGKNQIDLEEIRDSLTPGYDRILTEIAPGSGLILRSLNFNIET